MLTRWSDFDRTFWAMEELRRRMDRIFQEGAEGGLPAMTGFGDKGAWPLVNLYDAGETLQLEALVPGMSAEDIKISGNQEVLTVSGERKLDLPEGYSLHRQERSGVRFSRSFTFPCKVDMEKTSAAVKDGVLTVSLPKAAEAKPRQITVNKS